VGVSALPQGRSSHFHQIGGWEADGASLDIWEIKTFYPVGNQTTDCPAHSLVFIPATLSPAPNI